MYGDVRDDWKLNEIERKANEARERLIEIDAIRESVARLERAIGEIRTEADDLRSELQATQDRLEFVTNFLNV